MPCYDKDEDYAVEIAVIKIGYYNGTVIKLLKERGNCLKSNLGELSKVEKKITLALKENEKKFRQPVAAFITFTTQEARERIAK